MAEQLVARQRPQSPFRHAVPGAPPTRPHVPQRGPLCAGTGSTGRSAAVISAPRLTLREPPGPQWSLIDRGQVARLQGEAELAMACFDESIRLFRAYPFPLYEYGPTSVSRAGVF